MKTVRVLSILFIATCLGIIAGMFYNAQQHILYEIRVERAEFEKVKTEMAELKRTNKALILELKHVQQVNAYFDPDPKFIESMEAYEGIAGLSNDRLGIGGE